MIKFETEEIDISGLNGEEIVKKLAAAYLKHTSSLEELKLSLLESFIATIAANKDEIANNPARLFGQLHLMLDIHEYCLLMTAQKIQEEKIEELKKEKGS